MLAYIILSTLTRIAFSANQLWACCDVVARLANRHFAATCHNHSRIFMSLNNGIECGRMESVVRVDLAAADANALDVGEYLVFLKVCGLRCCHFFELNVLRGY